MNPTLEVCFWFCNFRREFNKTTNLYRSLFSNASGDVLTNESLGVRFLRFEHMLKSVKSLLFASKQ